MGTQFCVHASSLSAADPSAEAAIGKRERNKRDKLRRIVDAARSLFAEQGYMQTTTQQIASRAGVGAGTLFLYAPTKEHLLIIAFYDELQEVASEASAEVAEIRPVVDQLTAFFDRLLRYHLKDEDLARHLLREVNILPDSTRDYDLRTGFLHRYIREIVESATRRGEMRQDVDRSLIGQALFSAYWYKLREWANGWLDGQDFSRELHQLLTLQFEGLKPRQDRIVR